MMPSADDSLVNVLSECCELLMAGASIDACLERFPAQASALGPLLTTFVAVRALRPVPVRKPNVAAQKRAEFLAAAQHLRSDLVARPAGGIVALGLWWEQARAALAHAMRGYQAPRAMPLGLALLLAGLIIVGMVTTAAVTSAASALPGELLYPVKLATQQVQVTFAPNSQARTSLQQRFAAERIADAQEIMDLKRAVRTIWFAGVIEAVQPEQWVVSGVPVTVVPETRITGDPKVGAPVEVTASAPGDGRLVARVLRVVGPPPAGSVQPASIGAPSTPTGTATSSPEPADTPTLQPTATATPAAGSTLSGSSPLLLPTDPLDIRLRRTPTPTLTLMPLPTRAATRTPLPTSTHSPNKYRLEGRVTRIDGYLWTIAGVTVDTVNTLFVGNPDLDYLVQVTYVQRPDGSYLALEIVTIGGPLATPAPFEVTGVLQAMSGDTWTVEGWQIKIRPDTVIEGNPQIGVYVRVKALTQANREIWATKITVLTLIEYNFVGTIQEIGGDHWIIEGQTVLIDGNTQIIGEPAVGLTAEVVAVRMPDGSLVARIISVVVPDTPVPTPTATETLAPTATETVPAAEDTPTPTEPAPPAEPTATATEIPGPLACRAFTALDWPNGFL